MTREEFDAIVLTKLPSATGAVTAASLREALGICFDEAAKNAQPVSNNALSYGIGHVPTARNRSSHKLYLYQNFI